MNKIICIILIFATIIFSSYNTVEHFIGIKSYDNDNKKYSIINYNYLNDIQKDNLVQLMSYEMDNPYFILNWTNDYSQLYVITDINNKNIVIGCIGIKKEYDFYLICNLFILPKYRKKGFAKILLHFANYIIKLNGHNKSYLYCLPNKLNMYIHLGWYVYNYDKNNNIYMMKNDI